MRPLLRALAKDPADRPPSIHDVARALRACDAAGTWQPDDATTWWETNGGAVATYVDPDEVSTVEA